MGDFLNINCDFPLSNKVDKQGEMHPLDFYSLVIPLSTKIEFKLGYFSSNAISTLACGFAKFIYNGGEASFVINHFLNENDYNLLNNKEELNSLDYSLIKSTCSSDLEELNEILENTNKHFFNCLRFLIKTEKLKIIPVTCSDGAMSHYKEAIFSDRIGNKIYINGSCNFTQGGIIDNGESFIIHKSWGNENDRALIDQETENFKKIINKEATDDFIYLEPHQLTKVIYSHSQHKELDELLDDEIVLNKKISERTKIKSIYKKHLEKFNAEINLIKNIPKFPDIRGPRDYQTLAYNNWVENNCKGLFAMATGTGKTITALNCILEEFKKNDYYRFIVVVPSLALADQWRTQIVDKFNYRETFVCNSENKTWKDDISTIGQNILFGTHCNFCFIITNASFRRKDFQDILFRYFKNILNEITIIADECHTLGSIGLLNNLPTGINQRIGLSATPNREYDNEGTLGINEYFGVSGSNYTFSYSMKKAIDDGILCKYDYFPVFFILNKETEIPKYRALTKQLLNHLDSKTGKYKPSPEVTSLLIRRKQIIHKAEDKLPKLENIISQIGPTNLEFAFIYIPEGIEPDYNEIDTSEVTLDDKHLMTIYSTKLYEKFKIKLRSYTGETKNRQEILDKFSNGNYQALLAMKCLDEGVDIPRAKYAIFCSSTGNPRQFIQRRGRVLRTYEGKEKAIIYDLIATPVLINDSADKEQLDLEKKIFITELKRIVSFAAIADNCFDIINGPLGNMCKKLEIDLNMLILEELKKYEENHENI